MRPLTRSILGVEYRALRTPLALIDGALLQRLPERSRVRRTVEDGIKRLDGLAATLLTAPAPESPAATGPTPSESANAEVVVEEQQQIAEALLSDEEERKHVGELAEADEQTKHDLAELRAKHAALELEEERRLREAQTEDA